MTRNLIPLAALLAVAAVARAQCFETNFGALMPRGTNPPGVGDDVLFDLQRMNDGMGGGIFSFPMDGVAASYTYAHVQSNGVMFLTNGTASGATTLGYSTSATTMVNNLRGTAGQPPRIAPYWRDLNILAANGGGVWFNNTIPGKFVVTWRNAVHFNQAAPVFTLQVQLFADGRVDMYYSGTTQNTAITPIVGVSAGNAIADPGASVLSAGASSATKIVYQTFATVNTFDLANTTLTFAPNAGGGYDVSSQPCVAASNTNYGSGCYSVSGTFYESFLAGAFDLSGSTIRLTPNASGGYTASPGTPTSFVHTVAGLGLDDDQCATFALPSAFDYPGGSTTALSVCSNGFIWMQAPNASAPFSPSVAALFSSPSRLCPAWTDLVPDGATNVNNVFAEVDTATNKAYVTYNAVATFAAGGVATMQVEFDLTTFTINITYGTVTLPGNSLVGWAPGIGLSSENPGNRDISTTLASGFATATPEILPLAMSAAPAPVLGATLDWTISNIPATAVFTAHVVSLTQINPGIELSAIGAPDCFQHVLLAGQPTVLLFSNPTAVHSVAIPNVALFAGVAVFAQAASYVPGVNPASILTSNGVRSFISAF